MAGKGWELGVGKVDRIKGSEMGKSGVVGAGVGVGGIGELLEVCGAVGV